MFNQIVTIGGTKCELTRFIVCK